MSRSIKWTITLVAGAAVFVIGWWICDLPLAMETGNALGIAAVLSSLVLAPLGSWAGRELPAPSKPVAAVPEIPQVVPVVAVAPVAPAQVVAHTAPQVVVGPVPREPQHFQEPAGALQALTDMIGGSVAVVCAVTGLRGVGKTQAAGAYARQRIADGWLVAWIPAQSEDLIVTGLLELADALGLRKAEYSAEVNLARVRNYFQTLRDPALLVFDNVTEPAHVTPYLPATGSAQIVLTSTSHAIDRLGTRVPVELFPLDTAVRFLSDSTGLHDVAGAQELARELGCLPLALAQAAARVVRIDHDYATYLRRHQSVAVDRLLTAGPGDPYPHGVAKAILLAVEPFAADEAGREAARLLDLLSVLSPDGISRDLLKEFLDEAILLDDALAALSDASLIEFAGTGNAVVVMHRLTQRVLRDRADHDLPATLTRAAGLLREASRLDRQSQRARDLSQELIRHLTTLQSHATPVAAEAGALDEFLGLRADALNDLSEWYWRHDRPAAERILLRQALPLYRRLAHLGPQQRDRLATCLHHLGVSYLKSRLVDRAAASLSQGYELRLALAAEDAGYEESLAETCAQLGRALQRSSRFRESVPIAEHEVRLWRRLSSADGGSRDHDLFYGLLRLAYGQAMVGSAAAWPTVLEAEELGRSLPEDTDGAPVALARRQRWLADTMSLCGRHEWRRARRAEEPARQAVRIYRRLVDEDPRYHQEDLRASVRTLAQVLERLGRHAEAVDMQQRIGA